jgi:4-amino-4-deoxy-L-arabinose transferase-like glycosyltransferase
MWRNRSLWVLLIALALRLIYVAQIRDAPYFEVPLVDGANYVRTAGVIAGGDLLAGPQVFWQAPLYPYFLALLMGLFGLGLGQVYVIQALIGAFSCWLVYRIGRRLFGDREALWAALVMACYGPLIFFDAQPLIPVLHILLTLAGILFLLRAGGVGPAGDEPGANKGPTVAGAGRGRDWGLAGLFWGLSATATPNILLAVPVAAWWVLRRERAAGSPLRRRWWGCVALFLAGVAIPVMAVTVRNLAVAGEPVLISTGL